MSVQVVRALQLGHMCDTAHYNSGCFFVYASNREEPLEPGGTTRQKSCGHCVNTSTAPRN